MPNPVVGSCLSIDALAVGGVPEGVVQQDVHRRQPPQAAQRLAVEGDGAA